MENELRDRRLAALKAADAINAIEGAPVSDYARELSFRWVNGEISGEEMKSELLERCRQLAAEARDHA